MSDGKSSKTSLVLMDLQNEVLDPKGFVGAMGMAAQAAERRVVENAARALNIAREKGMMVVHVGMSYRKGYPDINALPPIFQHLKEAGAFVEGSWGAEFHAAVKPADREPIVLKRAVSGFSGTDLGNLLRVSGIDTVVLAGVATNFVVEGSARQAADEGFRVVVLKDCCSTLNEQMHKASLDFLAFLGTISTVDEFAAGA